MTRNALAQLLLEVSLEVLENASTDQVTRWAVNFLYSSSSMQAKSCLHCYFSPKSKDLKSVENILISAKIELILRVA
jgi:hypothetical protein